MKADAVAGDPDAIKRYEATRSMQRESYHRRKVLSECGELDLQIGADATSPAV